LIKKVKVEDFNFTVIDWSRDGGNGYVGGAIPISN
jgi:hypothetical protein